MKIQSAVAICSVALAAFAVPAYAEPQQAGQRSPEEAQANAGAANMGGSPAAEVSAGQPAGRRRASRRARQTTAAVPAEGAMFGSSNLVAEARRYIGTNPTGRSNLWCGAFMDMVLRRTGHRGGGNLARGYAKYGTRIAGPQVGAIAVITRNGGGHVGVVSGIDANGNPIVISGNHNNRVGESVYPSGRIIAYVMPDN